MSGDITAAAMQGRRKSLPDTRFVATVLHGRSGINRHLVEQHAMLFGQTAVKVGAHAGCRADQASIGERLSAVPGMRPIDSSVKRPRLVPGMRPMICVGEA